MVQRVRTGWYRYRSVVVEDKEILILFVFEKLCGDNDVSVLVFALVLLRNIDIAAGDGVQRAVFHGIQIFKFYTVVRLSVDFSVVDIQSLSGFDDQAAVVLAGDLVIGKGKVAVIVKVVAVCVQRNLTVLVDNVSVPVSTYGNAREVGIVFKLSSNYILSLRVQSGINLDAAVIYFFPGGIVIPVVGFHEIVYDLFDDVVFEVGSFGRRTVIARIQHILQGNTYGFIIFFL